MMGKMCSARTWRSRMHVRAVQARAVLKQAPQASRAAVAVAKKQPPALGHREVVGLVM
jgi:hypothetical protein